MEQATRSHPLTVAAFAYAATAAVALVVLPLLERPLQVYGAPHAGVLFLGRDATAGALWGLGGGTVLCGLSQLATRWTQWGRRLERLLTRLLGPLHPLDALMLAALSSLAEELVFRGVLLPYAGLPASSVLFGLAHFIPRNGLWPWAVWAAAAGFCMGWAALATGGLLAAILIHFVINAVGLLLLSRSAAP